jgi:hypothetical protein
MKKAQYFLLAALLICNLNVLGQAFNDSLYLHLYNYQVINGELKDTELRGRNLKDCFYIKDLVDSTNFDLFKIYKFHNLEQQEALTSFLVVENEIIEIYDILSFDALIERILDSPICEKRKTIWVKEIIKKVRIFYEDFDMERLVIKKDYGRYHYFIPLLNFKNSKGIF